MTTTFHEISVRFLKDDPGAEDTLKQVLFGLGYGLSRLTVTERGRHAFIQVYCRTSHEAKELAARLDTLRLKKVKVIYKVLGASDWRDKWKKDLKPFRLTQKFDVVPVWRKKEYRSTRREPIFLNTTLAFGTGLHETTQFIAQLIERFAGTFETFLDIGTGTGLLSVVAAKCGAKTIWAVDIDHNSIKTAQKNMEANGSAFDWCRVMDFARFRQKRMFDFVTANVITDELIRIRNRIVSAVGPGGHLAVSGVSLESLPRFKEAFSDQPLRCIKIVKGKKWAAILYRKLMKENGRRRTENGKRVFP